MNQKNFGSPPYAAAAFGIRHFQNGWKIAYAPDELTCRRSNESAATPAAVPVLQESMLCLSNIALHGVVINGFLYSNSLRSNEYKVFMIHLSRVIQKKNISRGRRGVYFNLLAIQLVSPLSTLVDTHAHIYIYTHTHTHTLR